MRKKHKKVWTTLNYFEYFLIFASVVTGRASTSAFASLVDITIGVTGPAGGFKIFTITAAIQRYKSIIMRKKKQNDKTALLAKTNLPSKHLLVFKMS